MRQLLRWSLGGPGALRGVCLAMIALSSGAIPASAQFELPARYRFEPGRELVYERRARVVDAAGNVRARAVDQYRLRCLNVDQNGALLLADWVRAAGEPAVTPRGVLIFVDERGQRQFPPEFSRRIVEMEPILDVLPTLRPALDTGPTWTGEPDLFGQRWKQSRPVADGEDGALLRIEFELDRPAPLDLTGGQAARGSFWFDTRQGAVARVEGQRPLPDGSVEQLIWRLYSVRSNPPEWCTRRLHEREAFLRCMRGEDSLLDRLLTEPAALETTLDRLGRIWTEYLFQTSLRKDSPFHGLAAARQKLLVEAAPRLRARAELAAAWLEARPAQWSLLDSQGRTVLSESLRAGTVLEVFWSSSSASSLRILAQLNDLDPAVLHGARIVCINVDPDLALAQQAARHLSPKLLNVFSGPPLGGEALDELPALRLIDAGGLIRRVWFGWRPDAVAWILEGSASP